MDRGRSRGRRRVHRDHGGGRGAAVSGPYASALPGHAGAGGRLDGAELLQLRAHRGPRGGGGGAAAPLGAHGRHGPRLRRERGHQRADDGGEQRNVIFYGRDSPAARAPKRLLQRRPRVRPRGVRRGALPRAARQGPGQDRGRRPRQGAGLEQGRPRGAPRGVARPRQGGRDAHPAGLPQQLRDGGRPLRRRGAPQHHVLPGELG
mmetsp:Transcript_42660/g.133743  ORF Transcript_42660/g.133743 Transcript_42660/m.133743 type:complete len:205 (+) Transcript_42660:529-1143(+)